MMKHVVYIENFGPVNRAEINLKNNFQILIGPQASGKSTICKVVYFCQKIRDYTLDFLTDSEHFIENHQNEYYNNYLKYLTRRFIGCFGKTTHMQKFRIAYQFGGKEILITLNDDGYVRFVLDRMLKKKVQTLISDAAGMFLCESDRVASIMDRVIAVGMMKRQMKKLLCDIFCSEAEIIYIPAGRSLLATMSEQLHEFSVADMDLTMQEFISLIRVTKSKFGSKIPDMVKDYTKTVKGQINNYAVEQAYALIQKILKADYTSENDGEKIYFDEYHWVKLMYGSSGQQEALWILMLLFVMILEGRESFIVVEEPEAHLFPIAQKDMISFLSLMLTVTGSKVVITTHSPYILTSANILLYSEKVEGSNKGKGRTVIPERFRIAFDSFAAYRVKNKTDGGDSLVSLLDRESHMIQTDYIDEVSLITNKELDRLIDMEIENDL